MKLVRIDKEECLGCGACVDVCPEVFAMGDDDKAEVVKVESGDQACIDDAIASCPAGCISQE